MKVQVKLGVKWTVVTTIVLALTAIFKISILTRFLERSDFGLMALINFIIGFMELFNDMGLTSAILHKQEITKEQYASLYWINWMVSIAMYLFLLSITPFFSSFYNQSLLNTLIPLVGLVLILSAIGRHFKAIEQKHLLFNTISIIDISAAFLSLILSIVLAVNNYGIFSLVYSILFQTLFSNALYFIIGVRKYGLLRHFRFDETKSFLRIGGYQVGGQVINYFNRDLDLLIIGKLFSGDILGGYSLAKQLVFRPVQFINPVLVKVGAPVLALLQGDIRELRNGYLRLVNIVASINIPMYVVIFALAPWIVEIFYGSGFDNIVDLVRILSIYMMFRSIRNPIGALVVATGRTDLEFKWNIFTFLVTPLFILVGSQFGIIGVSVSMALSTIFLYYPAWRLLLYKLTKVPFVEYFRACFFLNFSFIRQLVRR